MRGTWIALALVLAALAACRDEDAREREAAVRAEAELLADPSRAVPELLRRLRERVAARDGLTIISGSGIYAVEVVSRARSWKVKCDRIFGLSVELRYGQEVDDVLAVELTRQIDNLDQCRQLAPAVAAEVANIVK